MLSLLIAAETVALVGATVHSMVPGELPQPAVVLIEGDRITAVGPGLSIPEGARTIELSGLHLVPGLIDGLVGFDPDHDAYYVSAGVTTVRDVGNDPAVVLAMRSPKRRDRTPGPSLVAAGAMIDGKPRSSAGSIAIENGEQAEQLIGVLEKGQIDFLSVGEKLPRPAWERVVALGREKGLEVWGPLPRCAKLGEALAAGQRSFTYLHCCLPPDVDWEIVQPPGFDAAVQALAAAKGRLAPLLEPAAALLRDPGDDAAELDKLSLFYERQWRADLEARRAAMSQSEEFRALGERVIAKQRALTKRLHESGVVLLPSSGAPHPWLFPGAGLHRELGQLVQSGIPPAAVLRLATATAAETIGQGKDRGTIAAGKVADLLAVRGDPETDLAALERPEFVVLRGRVLPRAELDQLTAAEEQNRAAEREQNAKPFEVDPPDVPEGTLLMRGLVETRGQGVRLAGERWAVVREKDGTLAWCGRRKIASGGSAPPSELRVTQRSRDGALIGFQVEIASGESTISAVGLEVGGRMQVERRLNGEFLGNESTPETIIAIDAGSCTSALLLGQVKRAGKLAVLYFHPGLSPELVPWMLAAGDAGERAVKLINGVIALRLAPNGTLLMLREQRGQAVEETLPLETDAPGGGLEPTVPKPGPAPAPAGDKPPGEKPPPAGGSVPPK